MLYIREREGAGELRGLLIHDSREADVLPSTIIAQSGQVISNEDGYQVTVFDGARHQYNHESGILQRLNFDSYKIELPASDKVNVRWREPEERTIVELLNPDLQNRYDAKNLREFQVEIHRRFTSPLMSLALCFVGLSALLLGPVNRRGQGKRIMMAVGAAFMIQGGYLSAFNIARDSNVGLVMMYGCVLLPLIILPFLFSAAGEKLRRSLHFAIFLLAFLSIIYLFDMVELIRRGAGKDVSFGLLLEMGFLKLPKVGQVLLPFAILFSAMYSFFTLTKRYELIVVRAAGFSVWQFLAPVIAVAILLGTFHVMVVNPLSALLISRYEKLESIHLNGEDQQIAFLRDGLWLRQDNLPQIDAAAKTAKTADDGYMVFHALKVDQGSWALHDVSIFEFNQSNKFIRRYDAKTANLRAGYWELETAIIHDLRQSRTQSLDAFTLATLLTPQDIEESFAPLETISFWQLPGHISMLEESGFDATRLKVHLQSLLSQPLLFIAMVLLAASVSMRPPRARGTLMLVVAGIVIGFFFFFSSSFLQALGASRQIPPLLAAWAPALIAFMLGVSAIMTLEDG